MALSRYRTRQKEHVALNIYSITFTLLFCSTRGCEFQILCVWLQARFHMQTHSHRAIQSQLCMAKLSDSST